VLLKRQVSGPCSAAFFFRSGCIIFHFGGMQETASGSSNAQKRPEVQRPTMRKPVDDRPPMPPKAPKDADRTSSGGTKKFGDNETFEQLMAFRCASFLLKSHLYSVSMLPCNRSASVSLMYCERPSLAADACGERAFEFCFWRWQNRALTNTTCLQRVSS
jgi:hypothetical protein